ncbi:hypothetical protein ACSOCF_09400 [Acinetobacter baumannii]
MAVPSFQYVVKTLVGALDWNLNAQQATSLVNFGATNSKNTNIDSSNVQLSLVDLIEGLKAKGMAFLTLRKPVVFQRL